MIRIEAGNSRTIRSANNSRVIASINPSRSINVIKTGHYDTVRQSYADVVGSVDAVTNAATTVSQSLAQIASHEADATAAAATASGASSIASQASASASADAALAATSQTGAVAAEVAANISKLAAAGSAANAQAAETSAQNAASAIRGSHAGFAANYLGSFASAPTTGMSGAALAEGNLYLDTSSNPHSMKIYEGSSWVDLTSSALMSRTLYLFTASDGQHVFTGADSQGNTLSFGSGNLNVYVNGAILPPTEYSTSSSHTVTIANDVTIVASDEILIEAFTNFSLSDHVSSSDGGHFNGNIDFNGNTTFQGNNAFQGNSTVQGLFTAEGNVSFLGSLTASGTNTFTTHVTMNSTLDVDGDASMDKLTLDDDLTVNAQATFNNPVTFADDITATADAQIQGNLAVTQNVTVSGSSQVQDIIAMGSFSVGNAPNQVFVANPTQNTILMNGETNVGGVLSVNNPNDASSANQDVIELRASASKVGAIEATNGGSVFRPDANAYGWEYGVNGVRFNGTPQYLVPPGTILDFAGSTAPAGFCLCDGQALSRTIYADLFAILGTTYGDGGLGADQFTHFRVPDLRGRVTAGAGNGSVSRLEIDETTVGTTGGSGTTIIGVNHLPAHSHTGTTIAAPDHSHGAGSYQTIDTEFDTESASGNNRYREVFGTAQTESYTLDVTGTSAPAGAHSHTFTTDTTGGGGALGITQPTMILNKIIKY